MTLLALKREPIKWSEIGKKLQQVRNEAVGPTLVISTSFLKYSIRSSPKQSMQELILYTWPMW